MTKGKTLIVAMMVWGAACLQAQNVTIVDWDGTGVSGEQPLNVEEVPASLSDGVNNLSLDESVSWRPLEGYAPPDGRSADFTMALSSSVGNSPGVPHILRLESRGTKGRLHILIQGGIDDPPQMRGLLVFTKSNFLNEASDANKSLTFDKASQLSFSGIIDGRSPVVRWLVRDGDVWYVSEKTLAPQDQYNTAEPRELIDPGSTKWAEYDGGGKPLKPAADGFESHAFQDITAVGLFWDSYGSDSDVGGVSFSRLAVDSFVVEAVLK